MIRKSTIYKGRQSISPPRKSHVGVSYRENWWFVDSFRPPGTVRTGGTQESQIPYRLLVFSIIQPLVYPDSRVLRKGLVPARHGRVPRSGTGELLMDSYCPSDGVYKLTHRWWETLAGISSRVVFVRGPEIDDGNPLCADGTRVNSASWIVFHRLLLSQPAMGLSGKTLLPPRKGAWAMTDCMSKALVWQPCAEDNAYTTVE